MAKLKLEKDIVFIDLETTGVSTSKDCIVQIGLIKVFADGRPNIERNRLIKPPFPIPEEATAIHGITNEMVENCPTFKQVAKGLLDLIGDADFAGYNSNRFDIPLLLEEFYRAGFELDLTNRRFVDVMRNFHKMETRDLKSAYKFYCKKELVGGHDALNDIRATLEVLEAQLDRYKDVNLEDGKGNITEKPIQNDVQKLHDFVNDKKEVDFQGKIVLNNEGIEVFTFGKYQGKPVGENLSADPKYKQWILDGDFATDTKKHIIRLVEKFESENKG